VVKEQPDDADWDAGDIRYNVLRWTASPRPPFGGYGPSVANPLTGQIIAADIMLEYSYFRNRWLYTSLFTDGSTLEAMQPDVPVELYCSAGHQLHDAMMSGLIMADINGFDVDMKHQLIEQAMRRLILHEIGHTLGLNHNMKASQLFNASDIHDASKTQGVVTGSVMDYPAANIAPPGMTQGDYFDSRPGPYDLWAIEYGYSPALDDPDAEEARLQQLLARSTEKGLAFGNDAEDMRTPGLHIDPRVMIGDLSNEAIKYATGRFELVKQAFAQLPSRTTQEGGNYHQLMVSANYLIREWGAQAGVISRYIGGVYVDRAYVGQPGATQPYTPVDEPTQKAAMAALSQYLFAPEVMQEAQPLFAYLQPQRRGFSGFGKNEDPKLHQLVLNTQKRVLDHLLHKNVLQRLSDASLYGNQYELNEFLTDLTEAIFRKDLNTEVNTYRQNLQVEYVNRLLKISGAQSPSSYDYLSQAAATHQLKKISRMVKYNKGKGSTLVHRDYLQTKIEQALNDV
jgi:hypothetical protein